MNAAFYRRQILLLESELAKYHVTKSKKALDLARIGQKRSIALAAANRFTSAAAIASKQSQANSYLKEYERLQADLMKTDKKIQSLMFRLSQIKAKLDSELISEHRMALRKEKALFQHRENNIESHDKNIKRSYSVTELQDLLGEKIDDGSSAPIYISPNEGFFHIVTGVNGTGKSRYLGSLARQLKDSNYYKRIICLSGTVYEKFPLHDKNNHSTPDYLYFGNKISNNMFSEKSPFRELTQYLLSSGCQGIPGSMAGDILEDIGFNRVIRLTFEYTAEHQSSSEKSEVRDLDLMLEMSNTLEESYETKSRLSLIRQNKIRLHDIIFSKKGKVFSISDLSSGERLYLLTVLALCCCIKERTLLLFDEPENSLHPQWQTKIVKDIFSILTKLANECTVVIATHSPLIVSSAPNGVSYIRELPSQEQWVKSDFYGRNSDTILADQFGIISPRSLSVAKLIQDCLNALVDVHTNPQIFLDAVDMLVASQITLTEDDPLNETFKQLVQIRSTLT